MLNRVILLPLTLLGFFQNISKVQFVVFAACREDFECGRNSSSTTDVICCSGSCVPLRNCPDSCISHSTCKDGKICFLHRCEKKDIEFPFDCEKNQDCLAGEECESGQCKPAPRPVEHISSDNLDASIHFGSSTVVVTGIVIGCLLLLAFVGYCTCRGIKRQRTRRRSRWRGNYSQHFQPAMSFSSSRNESEEFSQYGGQPMRERSVVPSRTSYSYPRTPPPEYDSITLVSSFDVELLSPPSYDQEQREDRCSRYNNHPQVCNIAEVKM